MAPKIKVVTDAIRADARLWDQQTAPAQRAAAAIQPLSLGAIDIPLAVLVKDAINDIVPLLHALASGAGREFGQIASDLTALETKKGSWSGEAYDSYSSLTASQGEAASKLSTAASSIANSLVATGVGLIVFYASVVGATITVIVGFTAAGAATATGVGAPAGAAAAGLTALQWAAVIGSLIAASATLAGIQVSQINSIKSVTLFGGSSPFAGNKWPDGNRE